MKNLRPKTSPKPQKSKQSKTGVPKKPEDLKAEIISSGIDPRSLIFEHFWAEMMEKQVLIGKQLEENDRIFQQQLEERKRQLEESDRKFHRQLEERSLQLQKSDLKFFRRLEEIRKKFLEGRMDTEYSSKENDEFFDDFEAFLENSRGKKGANRLSKKARHSEYIDISAIAKQFNDLGFRFDDITRSRKIFDLKGGGAPGGPTGHFLAEIDIVLESADCVMAVDIKARPNRKDIEQHVNRLIILRDHCTAKSRGGKFLDKRKIYGAVMGAVFEAAEKQAAHEAGFFVIEHGGKMKIDLPAGFIPREW